MFPKVASSITCPQTWALLNIRDCPNVTPELRSGDPFRKLLKADGQRYDDGGSLIINAASGKQAGDIVSLTSALLKLPAKVVYVADIECTKEYCVTLYQAAKTPSNILKKSMRALEPQGLPPPSDIGNALLCCYDIN